MKPSALLVCASFFCTVAHGGLGPLGLREAVHFALENSPSFDSTKKTLTLRELERKTAIARLLPSFDFNTTNGLQNNIPIQTGGNAPFLTPNPSAPWYSSLSLGLTETLYDNGISLTNLKIASLNQELAAIVYLKSRDSLVLEVASEFYRFSLATVLLEVRKQQQAAIDKQFRTLSSQFQQGFKTRSDYLRIKTQTQQAEIERIGAENAIIVSRAELKKILGFRSSGAEDMEAPTFQPVPVVRLTQNRTTDLFPKVPPHLENFYDFKTNEIQKNINDRAVTLAKRNYWPQVFVSSGVTYSNQNFLTQSSPFTAGTQLSWNAMLTVQYNIWDWGMRNQAIQMAEIGRDIQANTLDQNLLEIRAKITGVMADLSRINRSYKLSQDLLGLEEESNQNLQTQYREGKVTYLDLITGLNNLLAAKVQFYTAYFDSLQSLAKYKFYEGKIYETLVEK